MALRYMGTKRHMVQYVHDAILSSSTRGRVVDLFTGTGTVAESLVGQRSVVTNDAFAFIGAISRARFTGAKHKSTVANVASRLLPAFQKATHYFSSYYEEKLAAEDAALKGNPSDLNAYFSQASHVANSSQERKAARAASVASDINHYQLACLYFSSGYFSLSQAIEIDALRYAIDSDASMLERDWLLSAWITSVSTILNAPGHTAQFLKPTSEAAAKRIERTWTRSLWSEFLRSLGETNQLGSASWRRLNEVFVGDALDLVSGGALTDVGVLYADPPYTSDQYSRYYHLFETLYRYDYPDAHGAGRVRSDRFTTGFCLKTQVVSCFHDLFRCVSRMQVPVVLSYPSKGLLHETGTTIQDIAGSYFSSILQTSVASAHSTMGASKGHSRQQAEENIYVCENR